MSMSDGAAVEDRTMVKISSSNLSLAQQSALIAEEIAFSPIIPLMLQQLGRAMRQVEDAIVRVSSRLGNIVDMVRDVTTDSDAVSDEATSAAEQLTEDLSRTVVALQFQDTIDQRINGIMQSLNELHCLVSARLEGSHSRPNQAQRHEN